MTEMTPAEQWNLGDYQRLAFENVIVSERRCARLAIPAGARVLDVACGTGNTALAAARRRADVIGIDVASRLLDRARIRASAKGLEHVRFDLADATALPFADGSFDFVLSTIGAVFVPNQAAAARELARVVRPGGTIALTAWSRQSLPTDVYHLFREMMPPQNNAPLPAYVWTDGPRAAELLGHACDSIVITHDTVDACFATAEGCFDNHARHYPSVMAGLARFTEEQKNHFRARFLDLLKAYNRATDGTLIARYDYATIVASRTG